MRSDWRFTTLGELIDAGKASLQTGPFGTALKAAEYSQDGVPLISVREIREGYLQIGDETPRVDEQTIERLPKFVLQEGDIVFGRKGGVDRNARVSKEQDGWFLGSDGIRLRLLHDFDSDFFGYQMRSPLTREWLLKNCEGTTMPSLNQKVLARVPVCIPPLREQKRIARILRGLDDKIHLNRRINHTLEQIAQAIFKSWFVDFDPVKAKIEAKENGQDPERAAMRAISGKTDEQLDAWLASAIPEQIQQLAATATLFPAELEQSENGLVPRGWSATTLNKMTVKIGSGATPRGGEKVYTEEGVALIRSQNVYDSDFIWEGLARISDDAADQLKGVVVNRNDVLLNITGASILRTCVVDPSVLPARVNQHVAIIRAAPGVSSRYIHLHLLRKTTKDYLLGMNAGGSREAVTKGHIESVPIIHPGDRLLERFQQVVEPLYAKIEEVVAESRNLAALRDALLPKLLSGEITLDDARCTTEAVA